MFFTIYGCGDLDHVTTDHVVLVTSSHMIKMLEDFYSSFSWTNHIKLTPEMTGYRIWPSFQAVKHSDKVS